MSSPESFRLEPPPVGPSARVQPVLERLPRGARLWRVHRAWHEDPTAGRIHDDVTVFNPGFGRATRFGPLTSPSGESVPLLYVSDTKRGALLESVLHDQMRGSVVDARRWFSHRLSALRLTEDLSVVSLHGEGLRSLGLYAADITHTYPADYPRAARWAGWLHEHTDASGLTWTSHQDDDERAFVLFGDRVPAGALTPEDGSAGTHPPLPLGAGAGLDWTRQVAASVRVEVIP